MSTVKMVQISKGKWEIISTEKGLTLQKDIYIGNVEFAEVYVKNFCSSYLGWSYEMVPMEKEEE